MKLIMKLKKMWSVKIERPMEALLFYKLDKMFS